MSARSPEVDRQNGGRQEEDRAATHSRPPRSTWVAILAVLLIGCKPSQELEARTETLRGELRAAQEETQRLRSEWAAERQRWQRSLERIESGLEELDRVLNLASAEIWGDGSSTGARLASAQRTLTSLRTEVDGVARRFRTTPSGP